jgi:hypothetical protein
MARFAYFTDLPTGETLVWRDTREQIGEDRMGCPRYRDVPAKVGYRNGVLHGYHADHGWIAVTRTVEMKSSPSRHVCDDRCMNATGRVMKCECSCGGENHGKGNSTRFMCEAA